MAQDKSFEERLTAIRLEGYQAGYLVGLNDNEAYQIGLEEGVGKAAGLLLDAKRTHPTGCDCANCVVIYNLLMTPTEGR